MRSVSISLPSSYALFQNEENFFGVHPRFESGIDEIVKRVTTDTRFVYIGLPLKHVKKETQEEMQKAIRHYCLYKIRDVHHLRHKLHAQTRRSFITALMIITTSTLLAYFIVRSPFDSQFPWVTTVVSEVLILIGWVSMWRPIELIVYRQWEMKREEDQYATLSRAIISVVSEEYPIEATHHP